MTLNEYYLRDEKGNIERFRTKKNASMEAYVKTKIGMRIDMAKHYDFEKTQFNFKRPFAKRWIVKIKDGVIDEQR